MKEYLRQFTGRTIVAVVASIGLLWAAWAFNRNEAQNRERDDRSVADRASLHEQVDRNTGHIATLIAVTRSREDAARRAIELLERQDRRLEALEAGQKALLEREPKP